MEAESQFGDCHPKNFALPNLGILKLEFPILFIEFGNFLFPNYFIGGKMGGKQFNGYSTAEEVADGVTLQGKMIIITGANQGIGLETTRVLAKCGAHIIMACRDKQKMESAIKQLLQENTSAKIDGLEMDLADSKSIDSFVKNFEAMGLPLHYLINNAGVMAIQNRMETKDGFEYQNGVNHLGHFRLTNLLLPTMLKTEGPKRIVCLSSCIICTYSSI
jgi:hypothetical protein